MKHWITLAILLVFTVSCNHVYREYDKESFPTYAWKNGQEINFKPVIEDISKSYKMTLGIRHLFGFQPGSIPVHVRMITPSGKEVMKDYELKIKDNNNYIGNCAGDLCDLEMLVEENIKFDEPGQYTYLITHAINTTNLPGIMEFGLIIDTME